MGGKQTSRQLMVNIYATRRFHYIVFPSFIPINWKIGRGSSKCTAKYLTILRKTSRTVCEKYKVSSVQD